MSRTSSTAFALFALAIGACGGASSQNSNTGDTASTTQTQSVATSSGGDSQRSSANNRCASMGVSNGMSIEGQLGTLRQSEVSATLNPALDRMHACYAQRLEDQRDGDARPASSQSLATVEPAIAPPAAPARSQRLSLALAIGYWSSLAYAFVRNSKVAAFVAFVLLLVHLLLRFVQKRAATADVS